MAKKETIQAKCLLCKHSYLTRRGDDPVISRCEITGVRLVANAVRICQTYKKRTTNYIIHKKDGEI